MRALVIAAWLCALCAASVAEAGVVIAGLSGDAQFTGAAPGAWSHTFVVYAEPGSPPGKGAISVRITDFQSDSGRRAAPRRPIEVTWLDDGGARRDVASFSIAVTLSEPDLYIATMVVDAPDQPPVVRQLSIQVGATAPPATALPVALVGPHDVEAIDGEASLSLGIRNTSSAAHTVAVAPPIVTRKRSGRVMPADVAVRWSIISPGGSPGVAPGAPGAATTAPIAVPSGTSLHLAGGGDAVLQVAIAEAPPGEYAVDVQLAEPGLSPVTISGSVFLKRGILVAILVIAAGVLLASAISRLRDVWLDGQAQRINLGQVVERLQIEPSGDAARDALRELRRQADDLLSAIPERRDCRADIENLGRRAVVCVRANTTAAELAEVSDGRRGDLRRKLDEVFRLITLPGGEAAATDKLSELESKDAERQELKAQLDTVAASVTEHQTGADAQLAEQLAALVSRLDHVRELYQRDELDAAGAEIAAIRDALARVGREAIQRASEHTPVWTSDASWKQAMAGVKTMLAAPGASYETLRGAFVDASVALTLQEVRHPDNAALAAAGDMDSKLRILAAIHADASRPEPRGLEAGRPGSAARAPAAIPAAAPQASPRRVARRLPAPFEWRALARRSMRVELMVLGVVMMIAVVAGVKALWIDNATWGGWGDLLAAFLWGSGVQVGAEAFVGLAALRAALGRRA